ncbi:MAG TPA: M14 family metallopeptidase [Gemmatimonadaceae bacterium]
MKTTILAGAIAGMLASTPVIAQDTTRSRADTTWHTVAGERHGISYFRRIRHPGVEYTAGDRITFDRYHTMDVMYAWMRRWAERHPGIVDVYEVGRSFEGRPILQMTLTNKATGAATTKPAAYFEGGRHSGEITGSESVLWLMQHLIEGYARDPRIKQLLDTRAIYLRPQNNPDGSELYLNTAQYNRSSVRPHDSDRDGLLDEDPPEDLDGDGIIYSLRWRVADKVRDKGNAIIDPRDPTQRLMLTVPEGQGDWRVVTEGIDNDGDGSFNEDGIGGLDLHRNYPENWRHDTGGDRTGRGYTQFGAGASPLSEPETRAVVLWLLANTNVSVVNSMDTQVPMHLRPPSTSRSAESMFPEDLRHYRHFDSVGVRITGYPWAGDVYETFATRDSSDYFTGDPSRPNPLFGHGPDFGYFYYGSIWYGDELWNGGRMRDANGDGRLDAVDALAWDDAENGGRGFREWVAFNHPQRGAVEIGGFHPKFFSQNGPPTQLERFARNQALFNLEMAYALPLVRLDSAVARRTASKADSADYVVSVGFTNVGSLPTALRQARLVKIVPEDRVRVEFDSALTRGASPRVRIVTPAVRDKDVYLGWTEPGESKHATLTVRVYGSAPVRGKVRVLSTRGGTVEREIDFGR